MDTDTATDFWLTKESPDLEDEWRPLTFQHPFSHFNLTDNGIKNNNLVKKVTDLCLKIPLYLSILLVYIRNLVF